MYTRLGQFAVKLSAIAEHSSDDVEPRPYEVGGVTVPAECAEHDIFLAD